MVKLDLDISDLVLFAENRRITEKKLKKYLKQSTKDELEDYIISTAFEETEEEPEEPEEPPEPPEPEEPTEL